MKNDLENFIRDNRGKFDTQTPPPEVLGQVLEQLRIKKKPEKKGILIPLRVIYAAAAAIILFAFAFAFWALQKKQANVIADNHAIVKPLPASPKTDTATTAPVQVAQTPAPASKSIETVDRDIASRKRALFARLKEQNPPAQKQVMFTGLKDMESAATRINAASQALNLKNAGNDVIDALVETLNTDPSANVRLAALDGLAHFYQESYVRKKLITSLKKQQDPLVQIAMINLLTRMKESSILTELEKMVNDENTQKPVKDCAYSGIMQLQSS